MHVRVSIAAIVPPACLLLGLCSCGSAPEVARQTYLDRGNQLFAQGEFGEAALNYRKSIQKDPGFGEAYYRLGLAELNQQHFLDAYQALSRSVELMPNREDAAVKLADLCMTAYTLDPRRPDHLRDRLTRALDQVTKRNPNGFDTQRLKGQLALIDRDIPTALDRLRAANRIRPMQPAVVLPLVEALLENHQSQQAETLARAMIQQRPTFGPMYDVLYLHYMSAQRYDDAENLLITKTNDNPHTAEFILQLANHYAAFNRRPEMASTLRRLTDAPKSFPQAHLQVGDFYAAHGDLDAALQQFYQGARETPRDAESYRKRIGAALARQGKTAEALAEYDSVLKTDPQDHDALRARAELWIATGRPDSVRSAAAQLQPLIAEKPDDPLLRLALGRAWAALGDTASARREFLHAMKSGENGNAARLELARLSIAGHEPQQALDYVNDFLARAPGNAEGRLVQSVGLMEVGRLADARSALMDLRRTNPDMAEAQLQLGMLNITEKRYKDADEIFRKLYRPGQSDLRPLRGLVESQLAQKQVDSALKLLSDELRATSKTGEVSLALATAALRTGRYDVAIRQYQALADASPNAAEPEVRLGEAYQQQGDLEEALRHFRKAAQLDPRSSAALMHLAYAADQAGRKQEALESYRRCLKADPDNPVIQNNLAYALAESNQDLDLAMKLAVQAQQKLPDNPGVVDTLGWVYLKRGLEDSALQVFQSLVRKYPTDSRFWYHLALARIEKGDRRQAMVELRKALANNPTRNEQEKIRELMGRIG